MDTTAPIRRIFWDVDTQADFMLPGGKLYVPGAEKIIPNLRRLVDAARQGRVLLVSSACAHTPDDEEFREFPPHCVQGTPGQRKIPETLTTNVFVVPNVAGANLPAEVAPGLQILLEKRKLDVFTNPNAGAVLERVGRAFSPQEPAFTVFGVVTEYCVKYAASGLLDRGRRVEVVADAIETLNATEGKRTLDELVARGARLITTDQALAQV